MNIRKTFFKYRSFTPIPLALVIIFFASPNYSVLSWGIVLLVLGESIRIWAVRYAGGATRTTKVGAPFLCMSGPYSRVRNPLYIGNMILYTAFVFIAGNENLWVMVGVTWLFFIVQYSLIVSLEEESLYKLFGKEYIKYQQNVPSLLPRVRPWKTENPISPKSIFDTLKTEKRTLQNIVFVLLLVFIRNQI